MAFFNITLLGPQDPFKTAIRKPSETKDAAISTPGPTPCKLTAATATSLVSPGELVTASGQLPPGKEGGGESPTKPQDQAVEITGTDTNATEEEVPINPSLIAAPPFAERKACSSNRALTD